jgi:hypothetical protein
MTECILCDGHGHRMIYTLRPIRRQPDGKLLKLRPEVLSEAQYLELSKRLPTSPLDWRPEHEGVLSVESYPCACQPPTRKRKQKRGPVKPAQRAKTSRRGYWWDR